MGPLKVQWTLAVEGLGKLRQAEVRLHPLLLFVGDNNSGKSYLASLLWAILSFRRSLFPREVPDAEIAAVHAKEIKGELCTGKHRLVEDRVQHDDANKKSDKNRLAADAKRHKHGNPHGKLNGGQSH